jgi:DNA gyrase subunit A
MLMTMDRNIPNGKNGSENPLILRKVPKSDKQGVAKSATKESIYRQKVIMTLSNDGFLKRLPISFYRFQHHHGKGFIGMVTHETDAMKLFCIADQFETLLLFTDKGKVFSLKWHEIPTEAFRTAKGMAITDLLHITEGEKVTALVSVPDLYWSYAHLLADSLDVIAFHVEGTNLKQEYFLLMATEKGEIKKTSLKLFGSIRRSSIIAMDIEEDDKLVAAGITTDNDYDLILTTEQGQSIRFAVNSLRNSSRTSGGVRAIHLNEGDKLVSMSVVALETHLLVVTVNGYVKLTPIGHYKCQSRGGVGIKTLKVSEKSGKVAAAKLVNKSQYLVVVSKDGMVISTRIKEVPGRTVQGVIFMRMEEGDQVASVAVRD